MANVHVLSDFRLRVEFDNGETRIFDAKSHLQRHMLKMLKSVGYFDSRFPQRARRGMAARRDDRPEALYDGSVAIAED